MIRRRDQHGYPADFEWDYTDGNTGDFLFTPASGVIEFREAGIYLQSPTTSTNEANYVKLTDAVSARFSNCNHIIAEYTWEDMVLGEGSSWSGRPNLQFHMVNVWNDVPTMGWYAIDAKALDSNQSAYDNLTGTGVTRFSYVTPTSGTIVIDFTHSTKQIYYKINGTTKASGTVTRTAATNLLGIFGSRRGSGGGTQHMTVTHIHIYGE